MKILIIGSGGREHAIGIKLSKSSKKPDLFFAPGNPGMEKLGTCVPVAAEDLPALLALAKQRKIDLTIVGPEVPLTLGIVDEFRKEGLRIFGPEKAAARLEGSKAFSKDFMARFSIPTAEYRNFNDLVAAKAYLEEKGVPIVVKASGLAAGKGAVVCRTMEEALEALESMLGSSPKFGEAGKEVVIEEFMEGEEASIIIIADGTQYIMLPSSQDHKQVFNGDTGPNTGGMGAYSPAPVVTPELLARVETEIIIPTLQGMEQEGCPYTGFLYVGLMISEKGPRVVEFNCRLGDPEAQVILPAYNGDLLTAVESALDHRLNGFKVRNPDKYSVVVVLASGGYPGEYEKGKFIMGLNSQAIPAGVHIVHAGTASDKDNIITAGGRVLGVVGQGRTLQSAIDLTYNAVKCVTFENAHFRQDIGAKGASAGGPLSERPPREKKEKRKEMDTEITSERISPLVGIISGSTSDKPIVDKVTMILDKMEIPWESKVLSAHRTPKRTARYVSRAEARGLKVLIGIAGLAAALPGVMAAHTLLPVIGVPGGGGPLSGVDALHSIVQMPPGIPVATVGIGNGKNAGFLAAHILALSSPEVHQKLVEYRQSLGDD